jgi:hypothetical protein
MPYRPPEPRWTRDLPRLSKPAEVFHDLPSLAMAPPGRTAVDWTRSRALVLRKACALCGCKMRGLAWVVMKSDWYAAIGQGREEGIGCWHPGGVWTHISPGPMHRSCALFSTLVCPQLLSPTARGRIHRCPRGDAAILGFAKYGIAFYDEPISVNSVDKGSGGSDERGGSSDHLFGYAEERERIEFVTFRDNIGLYRQALIDDD